MASACLNRIGISSENLLECSQKYSSYAWFSHRLSIEEKSKRISSPAKNRSDLLDVPDPAKKVSDLTEEQDPTEFDGFEFRLDDSVMMLPADELFSDGKLVPSQLSVPATSSTNVVSNVSLPDTPCSRRRSTDEPFAADPYSFSPRAPRCSSRWKELLGLGKMNQNGSNIAKKANNNNDNKRVSVSSSRSIRQFLNRSSKSTSDSLSINAPLLKDADNESVSVSSRLSLSSSSSGHDIDDLPRLSLDSDKPGKINLNINPNLTTRTKTRMVKTRTQSTIRGRTSIRRSSESTATASSRGLSIDSPRMNSSGKIVFHSLERSSSSPSSLNGGPRFKHRGMERSYSANVRITPVLNVPVCSKSGSMFGFPIFSQQKQREGSSSNNGGSNRSQQIVRNR